MHSVTTATLLGLILSSMPATVPVANPARAVLDAGDADTLALALLEADTRAVLSELGIDGAVASRVKSPDSLAKKAARKGISEDAVLDRLALRIRVDREDDCYAVMDTLKDRFSVVDGSTDDYIAQPKANGYQSLHAAVHTPVGVAEFQVRTHAMHAHAESGGASHELYKAAMA